MKISIIIPVFNSEKYIASAIESIANQTYRNYEIIIINDGSTDNTKKVVESLISKKNIDIKLISQKNKGVSAARNLGLQEASGEYVMFLDSDDLYKKTFMETVSNAFTDDIDVVFASYTNNSSSPKRNNSGLCPENILNKYELFDIYSKHKKFKISLWSGAYKLNIIKYNSIHFDENIRYGEDNKFVLDYLFYCDHGKLINERLYIHLNNPNSAMNNIDYNYVQSITAYKKAVDLWNTDPKFNVKKGIYMVDRAIWNVTKEMAPNNDYYKYLKKQYDLKKSMRNMIHNSDEILVKASSLLYIINPTFFAFSAKIYKIIKKLFAN